MSETAAVTPVQIMDRINYAHVEALLKRANSGGRWQSDDQAFVSDGSFLVPYRTGIWHGNENPTVLFKPPAPAAVEVAS